MLSGICAFEVYRLPNLMLPNQSFKPILKILMHLIVTTFLRNSPEMVSKPILLIITNVCINPCSNTNTNPTKAEHPKMKQAQMKSA